MPKIIVNGVDHEWESDKISHSLLAELGLCSAGNAKISYRQRAPVDVPPGAVIDVVDGMVFNIHNEV